jgi:hypothetical protein
MSLDLTIDTTQKVPVTINPVDSGGKPVVLNEKPKWVLTAGIATIEVADDGMSAMLISSETVGDSLITVSITGLQETVTLHVDLSPPPISKVASLGLRAGTPVAK